jgi:hypothetical protein
MKIDWPKLTDKQMIPGVIIGGALGFVAAEITTTTPSTHLPLTPITRPLIPITWEYNNVVRPAKPNSSFIKKCGFEFAINGIRFYALWDTGNTIAPYVMINEQTAAAVNIYRYRKSTKTAISSFVESGKHRNLPIYEGVRLTIPGVSTITTSVTIGGNNLINPSVFLPNHDIAFHSNFVTFLPKGSSPVGVSIPYLKGNETVFNWIIGNHHSFPALLDTGDEWNMVNTKIAHDIGLTVYPKTAKWNPVDDSFEFAHIVPIHLPGTAVQYMSEVHIGPGQSIISAVELLERGWGFVLRSHNIELFSTGR